MEKVIGIGEYIISNNVDDVLKIYGLASCIGMVVHCTDRKVLGVAHFLLPSSTINPELGRISPAYFVDTGVDILVQRMCKDYKCKKLNLAVSIYGGAEARTENDVFNIGSRNIEVLKKKLTEYNLKPINFDTGGRYSRTLEVKVLNGKVELKIQKNLMV